MPSFCRHNRFIERCPICRKTLPGYEEQQASAGVSTPAARASSRTSPSGRAPRAGGQSGGVRVRRELRAADDGYRSVLVPGLRASADALHLSEEIAFSSGRLATLRREPPGLYGEVRALAGADLEGATWACFLIAYGQWVRHASAGRGCQTLAFTGDPSWGPERRFERLFERLALPGFGRAGRYDLLQTLGCLGLYELRPDSLHLGGARGLSAEDPTTLAAKRAFAIGDPLLLERRAAALAEAAGVPLEALDLALANWAAPQRTTLGVPEAKPDHVALEGAGDALGL